MFLVLTTIKVQNLFNERICFDEMLDKWKLQ